MIILKDNIRMFQLQERSPLIFKHSQCGYFYNRWKDLQEINESIVKVIRNISEYLSNKNALYQCPNCSEFIESNVEFRYCNILVENSDGNLFMAHQIELRRI